MTPDEKVDAVAEEIVHSLRINELTYRQATQVLEAAKMKVRVLMTDAKLPGYES